MTIESGEPLYSRLRSRHILSAYRSIRKVSFGCYHHRLRSRVKCYWASGHTNYLRGRDLSKLNADREYRVALA